MAQSEPQALHALWQDTERIRRLLVFVTAVRAALNVRDAYGGPYTDGDALERVADALARLDKG